VEFARDASALGHHDLPGPLLVRALKALGLGPQLAGEQATVAQRATDGEGQQRKDRGADEEVQNVAVRGIRPHGGEAQGEHEASRPQTAGVGADRVASQQDRDSRSEPVRGQGTQERHVEVFEADDGRLSLVASGPISIDVEYVLTPAPNGSEVRASVSVQGSGLMGRLLAQATDALLAAGALQTAVNRIDAALAA
jgi:hypothetical protein